MNKRCARNRDGVIEKREDKASSTSANEATRFDTNMSRLNPAAAMDGVRPADSQLVLIVSDEGAICNVLQAPEPAGDSAVPELRGSSIDALWQSELADRIKEDVRRTIRSRHVQIEEFENGTGGGHYEFIFVPHARDRALVVVRDVSEHKTAISRMQHLAYIDEATKLPNREFLLEELRNCTDLLRLREGRAAVICFDIEPLDAHGDAFSAVKQDTILQELAARLTHELRGTNQPNATDYERYSVAARIDFRQFGVVLPTIESGADAEGVAKRLTESLQQPIKIKYRKIRVTARAGIALFPQDGTDAEALFENAMTAMEDAKNSQSIPYKFHSGTVKLRALQRQDLELELKAALDREEFTLNYLPIVDANTRNVVTVEALLRWPQAIFASQSIHKVVTLAEHTGLIRPIGEWVLRHSCKQLQEWHRLGFADLRLAVNLSLQEFSRADLTQRIVDVLEDNSIDPEYLDLEINEYMLFRDAMKEYATCRKLKELGVRITVDDYGTGACSLAHLSRSPVDAVKIDNSFVANAETNANDQAACAAITAMAHTLGTQVIAEGVETEEQASLLRSQGCDFLQGFLFCKPSSADEFRDYLQHASAGLLDE